MFCVSLCKGDSWSLVVGQLNLKFSPDQKTMEKDPPVLSFLRPANAPFAPVLLIKTEH